MIFKNKINFLFSDSLFKNATYLVANSILGSVAGFIFWLIAARLYTAQDVGLASTIISAIGLLALISNLGFSISLIRFLPDSKDKAVSLINSCLTVSASLAFILALIFIVGIDTFSPELSFMRSSILYAVIFILFTVLTIVANLQESVFVAYRKAKLSFIKMAIQSIAKIPVIFFLSAIGSLGIIASYGLAYLIAVVVAIFILIPRVTTNYLPLPVLDLQLLKRIFYYSIGNYIALIFETIPNFILPIIVLNRLNSEMTAYFYMAWMIAGVVFIVPKAVATSLFAEGSNNESVLEQNVSRSLKITAGLVIPALVITILFSDKILLVFGEDYSIYGEKLLIVLVFSALPMIFNNIYISKKRVQKDIKAVIHINAIITIGTLVIGFLAISKLGIIAIGIGWFTSQIISLVYIYFQIKS